MHFHFGKEGGAERFFVHLANAFARRGIEQRAVIRPNRSWRDDLDPSIRIIESNFRNLSLDRILLPRRVMAIARRERPDGMMAWAQRASEFMPDYRGCLRISRLGDYPKKLDYFRNTDCIVSNTPGIDDHVRRLGWRGRSEVISNFTRLERVAPLERSPDDRFVIFAMGRFVHRKGFDVLIRAVAQVDDAVLWLAGDGEEEPSLRALSAELGVQDRIRFLGWQDDVRPHLAASDVFVMPSRHEPLGNVILEAWAQDVPVVTSRSEGPSWFMSDGQDGLVVDVGDVDGTAAAIARLRDEPELRRRLVAGGRRTLEARFSEDAIVSAYLRLFENGVSGRPI